MCYMNSLGKVILSLHCTALDSCPRILLALVTAAAHCMEGFKVSYTITPTSFSTLVTSSSLPPIV